MADVQTGTTPGGMPWYGPVSGNITPTGNAYTSVAPYSPSNPAPPSASSISPYGGNLYTTPWGVNVGTGERAIAGPAAGQYANQEFIGGIGLTGGGFTGVGGNYQTPEDYLNQLYAKMQGQEVNPWLIPPTPTYSGYPTSSYAGIEQSPPPLNLGQGVGAITQSRQGTQAAQGMTYEEAQAEAGRTGGQLAWSVVKGWYVLPAGTQLDAQGNPITPYPSYMGSTGKGEFPIGWNPPAESNVVPPNRQVTMGPYNPAGQVPTPSVEDKVLAVAKKAQQEATPPPVNPPDTTTPSNVETTTIDGQKYIVIRDPISGAITSVQPVKPQTQITPKVVPQDEGQIYQDKQGNTLQINYNYISETGEWDRQDRVISQAPAQPSDLQRQQFEEQKRQAAAEEAYRKQQAERQATQDEYNRQLQIAQIMQQRYATQAEGSLQYRLQQEQLAAEKQQRLATLAANPQSWLEYAALAGTPPVIQPWMLPLGYQQYGFQVGQPIPGVSQGNYASLPELMTPSTQYYARMSPSARSQYAGYQKARQGLTPSDTEFYLWNQVPGGSYGMRGLNYAR